MKQRLDEILVARGLAESRSQAKALVMAGRVRCRRMDVQFAEFSSEGEMLLWGDVLVAEEDHVVGVQGVADGGHHLGRQRHRQVDATDLRPDGGREGVHAEAGGEGHGGIVPEIPGPLNPGRPASPTLARDGVPADERTAHEW